MTPSDSVLVSTAEVLLCPFITDKVVYAPKTINRTACQAVQGEMPDGQVPVGCTWNRIDPEAVPTCLARATPSHEMSLVRECDPISFENLEMRVRATMRGEQTDCQWRTLGGGVAGLYCSVVPQPVVLPPPTVPNHPDTKACDALVKQGRLEVGCALSATTGKVKCMSTLTETGDMALLKQCDVKVGGCCAVAVVAWDWSVLSPRSCRLGVC